MRALLTKNQMKEADAYTSNTVGIPAAVLMERAAAACARHIGEKVSADGKILIVCGYGNNGGDGLALGRILMGQGYFVRFFMCGNSAHATKLNYMQLQIIENLYDGCFTENLSDEYDIIVDALCGIGFTGEVREPYYSVIDQMNRLHGWKVALDIPSGLDTDTGMVGRMCFQSDTTITFSYPKWGLYIFPGADYVGKVIVESVDIFIPKERAVSTWLLGREDLDLLPRRVSQSHKGTYGETVLAAGSRAYGGAALLSALAAGKTGCGYVKCISPEENRQLVLTRFPECIFAGYDTPEREWIIENISGASAIAVGPGLSQSEQAELLLSTVIYESRCPLVVDADGLNLLSGNEVLLQELSRQALLGRGVILTPHIGEFSRLTGNREMRQFEKRRELALKYAADHGFCVVLKDARTMIASGEGALYLSPFGNSGMSTAGCGDVLTGMIVSLLSQGADVCNAAVLGVLLHGLSGDYMAKKENEYSLVASDIIVGLDEVLKGNGRR